MTAIDQTYHDCNKSLRGGAVHTRVSDDGRSRPCDRHRGRHPKASREGTRGELRQGVCRRALWRFDDGAADGRSREGARML
jgi:hypothetical protein